VGEGGQARKGEKGMRVREGLGVEGEME